MKVICNSFWQSNHLSKIQCAWQTRQFSFQLTDDKIWLQCYFIHTSLYSSKENPLSGLLSLMGLHSASSLAPKNCTLHFSNTRGNMAGSKAAPSGPALDTCTSTGVLELLLKPTSPRAVRNGGQGGRSSPLYFA